MKTSLFALLLVLTTSVAALAQADTLAVSNHSRRLRLAKVTFRTLDGGRINGILYALTDSTAIYFADTQAAINAFRSGQLPDLDTLGARQIGRLSVRREGHYLRSLALGVGIGGTLVLIGYAQSDPIVRILVLVLAVPVLAVSPIAGLFPEEVKRVSGKPKRFIRQKDALNRYTVETQRQRLRTEPVW